MLRMGAICQLSWMVQQWEPWFIRKYKLRKEYLELFTLVAGVLKWIHRFRNRRIVLFCNNESVLSMLNHTTSGCKKCMLLVQILVLKCMTKNVRIFAKLSSMRLDLFGKTAQRGSTNWNQQRYWKRFGG